MNQTNPQGSTSKFNIADVAEGLTIDSLEALLVSGANLAKDVEQCEDNEALMSSLEIASHNEAAVNHSAELAMSISRSEHVDELSASDDDADFCNGSELGVKLQKLG